VILSGLLDDCACALPCGEEHPSTFRTGLKICEWDRFEAKASDLRLAFWSSRELLETSRVFSSDPPSWSHNFVVPYRLAAVLSRYYYWHTHSICHATSNSFYYLRFKHLCNSSSHFIHSNGPFPPRFGCMRVVRLSGLQVLPVRRGNVRGIACVNHLPITRQVISGPLSPQRTVSTRLGVILILKAF
jgi:hypothetical protein